MQSALQRVQDHCQRVAEGKRSESGFPPELVPDVKQLSFRAAELRRMGFDVQLSPYLKLALLGE